MRILQHHSLQATQFTLLKQIVIHLSEQYLPEGPPHCIDRLFAD